MREMPMFPLGAVVLPGEQLPLRIFEPRYAAMIPDVEAADGVFGTVLIERGSELGGGDTRAATGTLAVIESLAVTGPGRYSLLCRGIEPLRIVEWLDDDPYPRALVEPASPSVAGRLDSPAEPIEAEWTELLRRRAQLQLLCGQGGRRDPQLRWIASQLSDDVDYHRDDPVVATFRAASDLPLGSADRLKVLAAPDPAARIEVIEDALEDLIAALTFRLTGQNS